MGPVKGDKVRAGEEIGQQVGHGEGLPALQLPPVPPEVLGQLPPADVRAVALEPEDHPGMEGLDAVVHLAAVQHGHRLLHQLPHVEVVRLQLHQQRGAALEQPGRLLQGRDGLLGALQAAALQLLHGQVGHLRVHSGGALQALIVDHRQLSVLCQVDVQLHSIPQLPGPAEGRHGVLRDAQLPVMEPPVGVLHTAEHAPLGVVPPPLRGQRPKGPAQNGRQRKRQQHPKPHHALTPFSFIRVPSYHCRAALVKRALGYFMRI